MAREGEAELRVGVKASEREKRKENGGRLEPAWLEQPQVVMTS